MYVAHLPASSTRPAAAALLGMLRHRSGETGAASPSRHAACCQPPTAHLPCADCAVPQYLPQPPMRRRAQQVSVPTQHRPDRHRMCGNLLAIRRVSWLILPSVRKSPGFAWFQAPLPPALLPPCCAPLTSQLLCPAAGPAARPAASSFLEPAVQGLPLMLSPAPLLAAVYLAIILLFVAYW